MSVRITVDRVPEILAAVRALTTGSVLVGVPGTAPERKLEDGEKTPITNAALGYIHEFGIPELNIPARPFLRPGVENASEGIVKALKSGAGKAVSGDKEAADKALSRAGLTAQNAVRKKITDGPFAALSERTIQARWDRQKSRLGTPIEDGFAEAAKPLLDTGQLRQAITFVIRKGK